MMNIDRAGGNTIVNGISDFLLSQTLECGQCFHFIKNNEEDYLISAMGRCLHVSQEGDRLTFYDTEPKEYEGVWKHYFDLDRDYGKIKEALLEKDDTLKPAIDDMWGVRILNQDFFETLISFIISQNQQIPRIKQIVARISCNYGKKYSDDIYGFPDADEILAAGEAGIKECKAGFRAPYIIDACNKYKDKTIQEERLRTEDYTGCISELKLIKGVGDKVANCVALFSLERRNAFPVDVWIKRIMENIYFGKETSIPAIQELAAEKFGEYGGYAQQYLFCLARKQK
ncbi:MAG: DNA-3-methyladenine glycosylase family protein [Butyrivibrio sp.]